MTCNNWGVIKLVSITKFRETSIHDICMLRDRETWFLKSLGKVHLLRRGRGGDEDVLKKLIFLQGPCWGYW
jgi:hypothetical protein